jgi:hypothetical protein
MDFPALCECRRLAAEKDACGGHGGSGYGSGFDKITTGHATGRDIDGFR